MPIIIVALVFAASAFAATGVHADVYKYVDAKGNTYFTDAPLKGAKYRLEWKRESRGLVNENRQRLASLNPPPAAANPVPSSAKSAAVSQSLAARRARFERVINAYARLNKLSPELLHAVVRTESAYNHEAVSHAGAQGLMQLMPGTAARYGVKDSFNPIENLRGGAAYLRDLLDLFGQDLTLALAGYNAGENAVIRNGYQIPPYSETRNYVRQVLQHMGYERPAGG
ncbi:lytic transglycosylase domain-containing protein [uncultured Lamprocystis sp.]|jgi:soluble lytic murein transglycosylase-like protein|uniref:lytic transglycosylase domain-containing protein n=1 Tax=uncultured Lamprocystis sp. TaxID=543132 RepID=UPI0025D626D7|nr:lytic transglycosylase domain-containing protein [uncultured Lamprocystis sp.]